MGNFLGGGPSCAPSKKECSKKRSIDEVDTDDLQAQLEEENLHTPKRWTFLHT